MMQAATEGALAAGGDVGGIKISREAGTAVRTATSYLPPGAEVYCRFLAPRKVALVDCAVRPGEADRTAYVFLPGGLGTMDELFELLTLAQLGKLGSKHPVPIIMCKCGDAKGCERVCVGWGGWGGGMAEGSSMREQGWAGGHSCWP